MDRLLDIYKEEKNSVKTFRNNQEVVLSKLHENYRAFLGRVDRRQYSVHPGIEYIYMVKGSIKVKVDRQIYILKQGDIIAIMSNDPHILDMVDEDNIALVVQFGSSAFNRKELLDLEKIKSQVISYSSDKEEIKKAMASLYKISMGLDMDRKILEEAYERLTLVRRKVTSCRKPLSNMNIDEIVLTITKNIPKLIKNSSDLRLEALAAEYNVSYSHLSRKFKSIVGQNYSDYISKLRINYAVNLLINTDDLIINISNDAGFRSLKNFNRTFKQALNMSPTEFREFYYLKDENLINEELHYDRETLEFLNSSREHACGKRRKLSIDYNKEAVFISNKLREIIDLHSIVDLNKNISNLPNILDSYRGKTISIKVRAVGNKFYLVTKDSKIIRLCDRFRDSIIKSIDYNDIKPIIQLERILDDNIELLKEELGPYLANILKKYEEFSGIIGRDRLSSWKVEFHIKNINDFIYDEKNRAIFKGIVEIVTETVDRYIDIPNENFGLYLGEVTSSNREVFIDTLEKLDLNAYSQMFYRINTLYNPKYMNHMEGIDCFEEGVRRIKLALGLTGKRRLIIGLNYIDGIKNRDLYYKYHYYSILYLKLYLHLSRFNIDVSSINILDEWGKRLQGCSLENTNNGLRGSIYYISKLLEGLEAEIIELNEGLVVTRGENAISIVLMPNLDSPENENYNHIRTEEIYDLNIEGLSGQYRITEYDIFNSRMGIREEYYELDKTELQYYQNMNSPSFKIDFKNLDGSTSLSLKKESEIIKLIRLKKVKA